MPLVVYEAIAVFLHKAWGIRNTLWAFALPCMSHFPNISLVLRTFVAHVSESTSERRGADGIH
jgi:hypothetical protein